MSEFKQYKRKQIAELRPVTVHDIRGFHKAGWLGKVSISDTDIINGSPKEGDMIARNPKNHNDQWLVSKEYFKDNFERISKSEEE